MLHQINTQYTQGTRIHLKHAHVILSLLFFLPLHSFLHSLNVLISVHTYFGALNCVREVSLLRELIQTSIKQYVVCLPVSDRWCRCISERGVRATRQCQQNNEDRRGAEPRAAFIKQDRDMDHSEWGSLKHGNVVPAALNYYIQRAMLLEPCLCSVKSQVSSIQKSVLFLFPTLKMMKTTRNLYFKRCLYCDVLTKGLRLFNVIAW